MAVFVLRIWFSVYIVFLIIFCSKQSESEVGSEYDEVEDISEILK